jgi:hypothetical protein
MYADGKFALRKDLRGLQRARLVTKMYAEAGESSRPNQPKIKSSHICQQSKPSDSPSTTSSKTQ